MTSIFVKAIFTLAVLFSAVGAQSLEERLLEESAVEIAKNAQEFGDPVRGAVLFHQGYMTCSRCHTAGEGKAQLGPKLSEIGASIPKAQIVESVLIPSKEIKKGYESTTVQTIDGQVLTGLLVDKTADSIRLRNPNTAEVETIRQADIDEIAPNSVSIMPKGLVNLLSSRQQFLDLCRYLFEIADGGPTREAELKPAPSLYAVTIPEYESDIDHAGMISSLDDDSLERGSAIYNRLCINCHGTADRPGSLPTSLPFASGKFKNGSDPYSMYQTLTRGFGQMVAQSWMVPQQKYDVIHYIRSEYLRPRNPSQYFNIDESYLASLPTGTSRGPAPSNIEPWSQMDYGPSLVNTYEIGKDGCNFAYKGIAVRLDPGAGGVAHGNSWMIFDHDTMRVAAGWTGSGFIDWNGIHFNGRHGIHPRVVGSVHFENPTGPGWARPGTDDFTDDRLVGRDDRRYGPLARDWSHYKGFYRHPERTVMRYTVGKTDVLESYGARTFEDSTVFVRNLEISPNDVALRMLTATERSGTTILSDARQRLDPATSGAASGILLGVPAVEQTTITKSGDAYRFDGAHHLVVRNVEKLEMTSGDYTIAARIRTDKDGPIFTEAVSEPEWVPNGKSLFLRGGRLAFDLGWVGAVAGKRKITDGRWHNVAMTWDSSSSEVRLYVDGKIDGRGNLRPTDQIQKSVVYLGYTSADFPLDGASFEGDIQSISFHGKKFSDATIGSVFDDSKGDALLARWIFDGASSDSIVDATGNGHTAIVFATDSVPAAELNDPLAIIALGDVNGLIWHVQDDGQVQYEFPASTETRKIEIRCARLPDREKFDAFIDATIDSYVSVNLRDFTQGGVSRYPERLETQPIIGSDDGPFAVDVLIHPEVNPWFCRARLTGLDYFEDASIAIVSAWDGNIWQVEGLMYPEKGLTWRRIADGLFQPLGVKIVDETIYITCRDQIVILRDLNGDGETDFYENFNNDHQVTDHFHEFAMGLQVDQDGNFYYAKSARHALTALVPHHGTLLRVSKDGSKTDIVARGFRAANGVCLNPDGSFIVTDQEGHWNPKNRINWVTEGGFYGNMFGYHDVTDSSDEAMEQPLCWITNAFDRSPSELLWVESRQWGPLNGTLLNFSYGYGKVYVVPHEKLNGQVQGGMCQIPIGQFPTGVMRGRFHPDNGQLYCCGMFAWAGTQQQPGGFYRIRYTGKPVHLPIGLNATEAGMRIKFSGELDLESAQEVNNYAVSTWSLKRTSDYGSKHYDEKTLKISSATLSSDRKSVFLTLPNIEPTWCMEIKYDIRGSNDERVSNTIHNTIHNLARNNKTFAVRM